MKTLIFSFFLALMGSAWTAPIHSIGIIPSHVETDFHHFDKDGNYLGSTHIDDGNDCDFVYSGDEIIYWHGDDC